MTNSYWFYTLGFTWSRMGLTEKLSIPETSKDQAALALGVHDGKKQGEPRSKSELESDAARLGA